MIITNIYGGLGNQMFQYAFGKSLSIAKRTELKLDISLFNQYDLRKFALNKFNINYSLATDKDLKKYKLNNKYKRYIVRKINKFIPLFKYVYFESKEFKFDRNVFDITAKYYMGYWQSYKYFENIRDLLLEEFTLKDPLNKENMKILEKINNTNSISLHIRRGDYVALSQLKNGHTLCPISYYNEAINYISDRISNPSFFIFSDDITWVKMNLPIIAEVEFINFNLNSPERDIHLMRHCKNNIIANSSFSWWGAWLNNNANKIVIAPKQWMNNLHTSNDLISSNWTII